jgi:hypothetical protein
MNLDEWNLGGGSGGGTGNDDDGNKLESASSTYQITGNQVVLLSREQVPPPVPPKQSGPSRIVILAAGKLPSFNEGNVDIRGSKGVRITAGPPALPPVSPAVSSETTDGVEIAVSATQSIKLDRGDPSLPASQSIDLIPGQTSIWGGTEEIIIAGTGKIIALEKDTSVQISSDTKITLAVGLNSITISQEGITIAVGLNSVRISEEGITIMGATPVQIMPGVTAAILPP